jgi:hypothetical protein
MHQREVTIGLHGLHEGVGHADRDIEVAQVTLVFGVDEFFNVGVVAAQHPHLCPASGAGRLDRFTRAVKHPHVTHRPGGVALGAAHPGAAWPDAREVVTHATAAPHGLGGLGQRGVDAGVAVFDVGNGVTHRLHKTVDQRGGQIGAGGRLNATGWEKTGFQRFKKLVFPERLLLGGLDLGKCLGNAPIDVGDGFFVALAVFLK